MHLTIQSKLIDSFITGAKAANPDGKFEDFVLKFSEGIDAHENSTKIDTVEDISGLMSVAIEMGHNTHNLQAAMEHGYEIAELALQSSLDFDEWSTRYRRLRVVAEKLNQLRYKRAERIAREANVDMTQLHNSQIGQPWTNVDYKKVKEAMEVLESQFDGFNYVEEWDKKIRSYGDNIKPR